jgi:hypothetical protein
MLSWARREAGGSSEVVRDTMKFTRGNRFLDVRRIRY